MFSNYRVLRHGSITRLRMAQWSRIEGSLTDRQREALAAGVALQVSSTTMVECIEPVEPVETVEPLTCRPVQRQRQSATMTPVTTDDLDRAWRARGVS